MENTRPVTEIIEVTIAESRLRALSGPPPKTRTFPLMKRWSSSGTSRPRTKATTQHAAGRVQNRSHRRCHSSLIADTLPYAGPHASAHLVRDGNQVSVIAELDPTDVPQGRRSGDR